MSEKGAKAHEVLMSLLQTLRLQDQDPQEFFKKAYLKYRQGATNPILFVFYFAKCLLFFSGKVLIKC